MKSSHKPLPTLEQVKEVIRRVDLTRLNNRLVGKPLIRMYQTGAFNNEKVEILCGHWMGANV